MLTKRVHQQPAARRGFTLIELLIVITVILILLALIIPAVGAVMANVRNAAVQTEITDLETKIADFKSTFKVEDPFPSRIILHETGTDWARTDALTLQTKAAFNALWPNLTWNRDRDFNDDGDADDTGDDALVLTGAECLVFFLGGMPDSLNDDGKKPWVMLGFSKNSSDPFTRSTSGNRVGPFLEFSNSRLVDLDVTGSPAKGDGMPEYIDSLPGQTAPFLYVYSNNGTGFNPADLVVTSSLKMDYAYYQAKDGSGNLVRPWKDKTYQIISPGSDGEYGLGGKYNPETMETDLSATGRKVERDNITNFKSGTLGN